MIDREWEAKRRQNAGAMIAEIVLFIQSRWSRNGKTMITLSIIGATREAKRQKESNKSGRLEWIFYNRHTWHRFELKQRFCDKLVTPRTFTQMMVVWNQQFFLWDEKSLNWIDTDGWYFFLCDLDLCFFFPEKLISIRFAYITFHFRIY